MSNTNNIDALAYASIPNNIPTDELDNYGIQLQPITTSIPDYLNGILDQTTLKRFCCIYKNNTSNNSETINVRIPIPNQPYEASSQYNATQQKFGYYDKVITLPLSVCDSVPGYSNDNVETCDTFMSIYCNNAKLNYTNEVQALGQKYSDLEFSQYKPECACYANRPSYMPSGVPPPCYADGCNPDATYLYLDKNSRQPCNTNVCVSIFKAATVEASGGSTIKLSDQVAQNCGYTGSKQIINPPSQLPVKPVKPVKPSPPPPNKPSSPPSEEPSGIGAWFSKKDNYIGWIIVVLVIGILLFGLYLFLKRKNKK